MELAYAVFDYSLILSAASGLLFDQILLLSSGAVSQSIPTDERLVLFVSKSYDHPGLPFELARSSCICQTNCLKEGYIDRT